MNEKCEDDGYIFGVCSELGERLDIDPLLFRVIFIIMAVGTDLPVFLIYTVIAIILFLI